MERLIALRSHYSPHLHTMKKLLFILPALLIPILMTNSVSAVAEDITYTIDTNSTVPIYFCDNTQTNTQVKCSDYSNIIYHPSGFNPGYLTMAVDTVTIRIPNFTDTIFDLSTVSTAFIAQLGSIQGSNATLTVTLTNSLDCPEPQPCPEPLPVDRSPVMDDFHNVFINTMLSVIPITAIIFVVWFFIDMLSSLVFGRGK